MFAEKLKVLGLSYKIMLDIDRDRVSRVIGAPPDYKVHAIVGLGYAIEPEEPQPFLKIYKDIFG